MLVGNQDEATFIHNWYHAHARLRDYYVNSNLPEGWQFLGAGSFRAAYLSPSGVVYKVQKDLSGSRYQTNKGEYDAWRRLYFNTKMPRYSRLPKMGYFPVDEFNGIGVVAIERLTKNWSYWGCVPGTNDTVYWNDIVRDISNRCKIGDLGGNNLFLSDDEKTIIPTDLADTW